MEEPLISIGLLTYNHEKYISDALEGLMSQNYKQIELIILDDGSADRTPLIIQQYMERLKKRFVKVVNISNYKNCGNIPHNCNRMIMKMRGEFYFKASGDDVLLPDAIGSLYRSLLKHPECAVVHSSLILVEDSYTFGDKFNTEPQAFLNKKSGVEPNNLFQQLMAHNINVAAPTVLLRKEIISKYGYHDENIAFEDYEYWLRISQTEKFYYLDKPTVLYRRADTSASNYEVNSTARLKTAMNADFLSRNKYVEKLTGYEQIESWKIFYNRYIQLCIRYRYKEGLCWLEKKGKEMGIELQEDLAGYKNRFRKCCKEEDILTMWIEIKDYPNILGSYLRNQGIYETAIYGYSRLGIVLKRELLKNEINVSYIIDRKGKLLDCEIPVYTLKDALPPTDAIIVAPVELYEEIESILRQKQKTKILNLSNVIEEISRQVT